MQALKCRNEDSEGFPMMLKPFQESNSGVSILITSQDHHHNLYNHSRTSYWSQGIGPHYDDFVTRFLRMSRITN